LEKARVKKAQAASKVDVLTQLDFGEVDKKKRKNSETRASIPVKAPSPSAPAADKVADVEGEETPVKSPAKKRSKSLIKKNKKGADTLAMQKDLQEVDDVVVETSPILDGSAARASQAGGSSPWDHMFNPEVFLERMLDMAGNSSRFHSTSTDELLKMALGHEFKGLLLNYALAARQRSEIASAKEKAALIEKNLDSIERDVAATKEKLEGELKSLKDGCEEEFTKLVKAHEGELAIAKRDRDSAMKTVKVLNESLDAKDQRIKTLAKDNEAALSELASLRQDNQKLVSEKENLKENLGLILEEGFNFALDQVKVLFPDIDHARLGEADAMHKIDGDKLVPYALVETARESPAKE
jgi:hypothetical protein